MQCTIDDTGHVLHARTDRDVYVSDPWHTASDVTLSVPLCLCNSRLQQSAHRVDSLTHSRWLKDLEHPSLFVGAIGAPDRDQLSWKESLHRSPREQSTHLTPSSIRALRSHTSTVSDIGQSDNHLQRLRSSACASTWRKLQEWSDS